MNDDNKLFIPPRWSLYNGSAQNENLISVLLSNIKNDDKTLILGDGGQGKTTILKTIFIKLIDSYLIDKLDKIPIYIPLRDINFATNNNSVEYGKENRPLNIVWNYLDSKIINHIPLVFAEFDSLAKNNELFFILDGFDEVAEGIDQYSINRQSSSEIFSYPSVVSFEPIFLRSTYLGHRFNLILSKNMNYLLLILMMSELTLNHIVVLATSAPYTIWKKLLERYRITKTCLIWRKIPYY